MRLEAIPLVIKCTDMSKSLQPTLTLLPKIWKCHLTLLLPVYTKKMQ